MTNVIWPVPPNGPNGTYVFAWDQDYGERAPESFHNGLDFSNYPGGSTGVAVVAVASGVIVGKQIDSYRDTALGNYIWIDHGDFQSRYCHMQAGSHSHLSVGASISQGAKVGNIGNTGTATTGAHLHLDIYVNGARIDPQAFIRNNFGVEAPEPIEEETEDVSLRIILDPTTNVQYLANSATGKRVQIVSGQQSTLVRRYLSRPVYASDGTLSGTFPNLTLAELDIVLGLVVQTA